MAQPPKTPVMVLQELTVKLGHTQPVYELIPELTKQGTHKNEFFYQVQAFDCIARGTGSSKQIAKHDAAKRMLQLLQNQNIYHPAENPVQGFVPGSATLNDQPIKTSVNCIGSLCDLCEENNIPQPEFKEISDVGPPHCRQFTYDCIVNSVRTRATASTKKQAKQLAAKDMLEKCVIVAWIDVKLATKSRNVAVNYWQRSLGIKDILPELAQESNLTAKQIAETDEAAVNTFLELSPPVFRKPDYCARIRDYDLVIKNIMKEKNISWDELKESVMDEYEEGCFNWILEKLELHKNFITLPAGKMENIVILIISTNTPPFSTIGQGKTEDEAKFQASKDAFEKMINWMK